MTSREDVGSSDDNREVPALRISFEDSPEVLRRASTEDYTTHVAPPSWRSGRLSLTMAFWAFLSGMFWMYLGALTASTAGTEQAVIGLTVSVAIFAAVNTVFSRYAIATGVTSALLSRRVFGATGAALAPLLFAVSLLFFTVVEGAIIGQALQQYFGGPISTWYLVAMVVTTPLVLGGVRTWLDRLNGVLLPVYLIGVVVIVIVVASSTPDATMSVPAPRVELGAPGWLWVVSVTMGVWALMLATIDIARFGRRPDSTYHGLVTFGPVFHTLLILGNGLIGIFLQASTAGSSPSELGVATTIVDHLGLLGLLFVIVSQVRTNTANLYLASSNTESFTSRILRIRWSRTRWAVLVGLLAYLIMLTDVFSYILQALAWQAVFLVGWVGIVGVHVLTSGRDDTLEFRVGRLRAVTPALVVWILASAAGIVVAEVGGPTGSVVSPFLTLVVSAVGYYVVKGYDVFLRRGSDPRHEVDDEWEARIECHACGLSYVAVEMDRDPSSAGQAICSACADDSPRFIAATRAEGTAGGA